MLIMGILFRNEILLFLFQLIFMCFLRSFSGGFHFYSYWSCLLASVLYMSSLVFIFPNITALHADFSFIHKFLHG